MNDQTHTDAKRRAQAELERRITELERPDYPFPRRFGRWDWLLWGLVVAVCLVLVVLGAWL